MNKSLLGLGLGLMLALPTPVLRAQSGGGVQLSGHVLAVVKNLPGRGHLAATNLDLAIGLPLRNKAALTNLLEQINDPASANYHKYLTPAQFTEQFGPTEQDYQAVVNFAQQHGLQVTATHGNRMLVDVRGVSTDIEKAFQVNFQTYQHPSEARQFFATTVEPTVPIGLPVLDISGLNNFSRPKPHLLLKPINTGTNAPAKGSTTALPQSGTGIGGTYLGNDFRNAYVPQAPQTGAGQTVALVEFDGYFASDIQQYEQLAGRSAIPLQNVLIDGFNGQPYSIGGNGEVSLDIEMLIAMAPGLSGITVYEGSPYSSSPNDVINRIATDDSASQISSSWGWIGGPSPTADQIYQEFIVQGQSYYQAAGDSDAYPNGSVDNVNGFGQPSDSPYVTSVGGTTLTMTPNGGARVSETVWNWDVEYGTNEDGVGSSGGFSSYYPIPSWQTNVNMTINQGSTSFRNFPDVALTADNIFIVYAGGAESSAAGTSAAAPLWAAFTALVNQQESAYNHNPIGFINPALYAIANSINYNTCFNDITTGSNTWSSSPSQYVAVPNYDLCTGLGTPNGINMINALVGSAGYVFKASAPPAPYGVALSALSGGTPNGAWNLFVQDTSVPNTGIISNGWSVAITLGYPLGGSADLGLTLSSSATTVAPTNLVTFYLAVTNYGGLSPATNVVVQNTLTAGTLVSSTPSIGTVQGNGQQLSWSIGTLSNYAGATLALKMLMPSTSQIVYDQAQAQSQTPNPNPDDSSASVSVTVGATSPPILSPTYNAGTGLFIFNVTGTTGSVEIEFTTNLANSASWTPVETNTVPFSFTNANTKSYHQIFYRAITVP